MLKFDIKRKETDRESFYERLKDNKPSPEPDFEHYKKLRLIGQGGFGLVFLYKHKSTGEYYACKRLQKVDIVKKRMVAQVLKEKKILYALDHPLVIRMLFSWKDNDYLYFFMPFVWGGNILTLLENYRRKFTESVCCFFAAQLLLAVGYLHDLNVSHRDIKPENVLVEPNGYIKLADFGLAEFDDNEMRGFCGTIEYMSPEMVRCVGYGKSTDWWSFGILIWEMAFGETPFYKYRDDRIEACARIRKCEFVIPKCSEELHHLLSNLLVLNVKKRLGCNDDGANGVMAHQWFRGINWHELELQQMKAPLKPKVKGPGDICNFEFIQETVTRSSRYCLYKDRFLDA